LTDALEVNRKTTALLLMDFQRMIVAGHADHDPSLLPRAGGLLRAARRAEMRVIHVVVGFRAGHPEISDEHPTFATVKAGDRFAVGDPMAAIVPELTPGADEPVVTKRRISAFFGTDLDLILRANRIESLILAGVATSGVVLSTLRHAADADYSCLVARDACADADEEVHRVLMDKVFARQAQVAAVGDLIAALI
jgi:nicotinamidase-related amidase